MYDLEQEIFNSNVKSITPWEAFKLVPYNAMISDGNKNINEISCST